MLAQKDFAALLSAANPSLVLDDREKRASVEVSIQASASGSGKAGGNAGAG